MKRNAYDTAARVIRGSRELEVAGDPRLKPTDRYPSIPARQWKTPHMVWDGDHLVRLDMEYIRRDPSALVDALRLLADPAAIHVDTIDLYGADVDDISWARALPRLRDLSLYRTSVQDLSPLAGHPALHDLNLGFTPVADLTPLAGLPLQRLWLNDMPNLVELGPVTELSNLRELWVCDSALPEEVIAAFARARPDVVLT